MLYSNPEFFLFFSAVLIFYFVFRRYREARFNLLIAASLFFYAWAGLFDSLVFFFVVFVSWLAIWLAHRTDKVVWRKGYLAAGITIMAAHLLFWKYAPWLTSLAQTWFPSFAGGKKLELPLPVGISFFTLQGIAYLVDFGRGQATYLDFRSFLLFKSFFPQLVAGPIVRLKQLAPQLRELPMPGIDALEGGMALFALGFFKKVAIADRMAVLADPVFADPHNYSARSIFIATLAYTVQIWGDFSGYTDMGRGAARMLGIDLPENFYSPYFSRSPSEFWRRWHVTLSQWIRDYIYIPLGGGQGSLFRVVLVAMTTMTISGLWHGAATTFLAWGIYHGMLLTLERAAGYLKFPLFKSWAGLPLMFAFTFLGWLVFRAESMSDAMYMAKVMLTGANSEGMQVGGKLVFWGLATCFAMHLVFYRGTEPTSLPLWRALSAQTGGLRMQKGIIFDLLVGSGTALLIVAALFLRHGENSAKFIYFQF